MEAVFKGILKKPNPISYKEGSIQAEETTGSKAQRCERTTHSEKEALNGWRGEKHGRK